MLNQLTLQPGQQHELIFINEPNMDWHIIQQANSSLRVHILFLSETDEAAQWQSRLTIEQNATGCRTEIYAMGLLHDAQQAHLLTRVHHITKRRESLLCNKECRTVFTARHTFKLFTKLFRLISGRSEP
jgi:hypothetical protein